ncbi:paramyosin, short form-like [Copidosoma floridanum]|uniref:paramyosin, short form-like n=1 Tax=Copidosoma floridanum TaxID=29053 RepID=UPI0006C97F15|nr:paramyosin, short form-like [Copidosoma floridanum]
MSDVPLAQMPVAPTKWRHLPTTIYEKNYGFGINYYQPMIDYLDRKESAEASKSTALKAPLPFTESRASWEHNYIVPYSRDELARHTIATEMKAKEHLENFKAAQRSDFSRQKCVQAARVSKEVYSSKFEAEATRLLYRRAASEPDSEFAAEEMAGLRSQALRELQSCSDEVASGTTTTESYHQHGRQLRGKSAKAIEFQLKANALMNLSRSEELADIRKYQREVVHVHHDEAEHQRLMEERFRNLTDLEKLTTPLASLSKEMKSFEQRNSSYLLDKSKQTSIEIEQLNARVVEAEIKLKTEVQRVKKKLQIQITELELSLDVANKTNIDLQKTIKKQSLTLTELQAHYDEVQRQLQVTLDQLGISQRRLQSLTSELEEVRGNYESALRAKRTVEQAYEEATSRINELTTINVNIASSKAKLEQELSTLAGDYEEVTKELRVSDERYQRVQNELKHTVEILHEEQERIVKIEAIKKSLEIEVKNISVRLEEVEANAIVGGKRIISKLEARIRDLELELDEEKRRHAETVKILRKKERNIKEVMIQVEEDSKNIALLQESLDKASQKVNIYKRQLTEQEGMSQQSVTRVRRFQRELEAAEDRADTAESNLTLIRAKHRSFVTTSSVPGSQVYLVQESRQEL